MKAEQVWSVLMCNLLLHFGDFKHWMVLWKCWNLDWTTYHHIEFSFLKTMTYYRYPFTNMLWFTAATERQIDTHISKSLHCYLQPDVSQTSLTLCLLNIFCWNFTSLVGNYFHWNPNVKLKLWKGRKPSSQNDQSHAFKNVCTKNHTYRSCLVIHWGSTPKLLVDFLKNSVNTKSMEK